MMETRRQESAKYYNERMAEYDRRRVDGMGSTTCLSFNQLAEMEQIAFEAGWKASEKYMNSTVDVMELWEEAGW